MRNIAALIGLVGAVSNNGKTNKTDDIIRYALCHADSDQIIDMIHEEKYAISPNCKTCKMPCGNTSDYDVNKFDKSPKDIQEAKEELLRHLIHYAETTKGELSEDVYRAISYMGYDLTKETYEKLITDLNA